MISTNDKTKKTALKTTDDGAPRSSETRLQLTRNDEHIETPRPPNSNRILAVLSTKEKNAGRRSDPTPREHCIERSPTSVLVFENVFEKELLGEEANNSSKNCSARSIKTPNLAHTPRIDDKGRYAVQALQPPQQKPKGRRGEGGEIEAASSHGGHGADEETGAQTVRSGAYRYRYGEFHRTGEDDDLCSIATNDMSNHDQINANFRVPQRQASNASGVSSDVWEDDRIGGAKLSDFVTAKISCGRKAALAIFIVALLLALSAIVVLITTRGVAPPTAPAAKIPPPTQSPISSPTIASSAMDDIKVACSWIGVDDMNACASVLSVDTAGFVGSIGSSIPSQLGVLTQLTSLDLSFLQLQSSIPTQLGMLTRLAFLDLSYNSFEGSLPTELGMLTALTELHLITLGFVSNGGSIPTEMGLLAQLIFLDISKNALTGEIPPQLGGLTQLETLALDSSGLVGTIPTELGTLTELIWLALHYNFITGTLPTELGRLTQLDYLSLRSNAIEGTLPSELRTLTQLGYFSLHSNAISGTLPTELGLLTQLSELDLTLNSLTGEIIPELGMLTQLSFFDLGRNILQGVLPTELGLLTQLTFLGLHKNEFSGPIPELGMLSQLTDMLLYSNDELSGSISSLLCSHVSPILDCGENITCSCCFAFSTAGLSSCTESTETVPTAVAAPSDLTAALGSAHL